MVYNFLEPVVTSRKPMEITLWLNIIIVILLKVLLCAQYDQMNISNRVSFRICPRGVEMGCSGILGGQIDMILLKANIDLTN